MLESASDEASKVAFIENNLRTDENPNGLLVGPRETFFGEDGSVCMERLMQRARMAKQVCQSWVDKLTPIVEGRHDEERRWIIE